MVGRVDRADQAVGAGAGVECRADLKDRVDLRDQVDRVAAR